MPHTLWHTYPKANEAMNLALVHVDLSAAIVKAQHTAKANIVLTIRATLSFFMYFKGHARNPQRIPTAMPANI